MDHLTDNIIIFGIIIFYIIYLNSAFHLSRVATRKLLSGMSILEEDDILDYLKNNPDFCARDKDNKNIAEKLLFAINNGRQELLGSEIFWEIGRKTYPSIATKIQDKYNILLLKARQKIYKDDYGMLNTDGFEKEFSYFVNKVLCPPSYNDKETYYNIAWGIFLFLLKKDGLESLEYIQNEINLSIDNVKTGIDYENYIGGILQKAGFEIIKTPITGDQGVDLIAKKDDIKFAIQCKYYSKSVGNKAVQEVIAGKSFYECDVGVVCSNNSFTRSAQILAQSEHITLSSQNDIVEKLNHKLVDII